uniref:Pro-resilin n=1 Tax=Cacopsylla melanoneura TaxID=428564 RepID=A0A8D9F7H5_9HEMI
MLPVFLCLFPLLRLIHADSSKSPIVKRYSTLTGVLAAPPLALQYPLHTAAIFPGDNTWDSTGVEKSWSHQDVEKSWPQVEERIDPIYVPEVEYKRPVATSHVSVAASHWGGDDNEDDLHYGPAKYEFGYKIEDSNTWSDFGHREGRIGDLTWGSYEVLLPDGRKQIVEYEADSNGYRPRIRYEVGGVTVGTEQYKK